MVIAGEMTGAVPDAVRDGQEADRRKNRRDARPGFRGLVAEGGGMARFGDLEAAIMDVIWAAGAPVPAAPFFGVAARQIAYLVEVAADDAAARRAPRLTVAAALLAVAAAGVPAGALGAG